MGRTAVPCEARPRAVGTSSGRAAHGWHRFNAQRHRRRILVARQPDEDQGPRRGQWRAAGLVEGTFYQGSDRRCTLHRREDEGNARARRGDLASASDELLPAWQVSSAPPSADTRVHGATGQRPRAGDRRPGRIRADVRRRRRARGRHDRTASPAIRPGRGQAPRGEVRPQRCWTANRAIIDHAPALSSPSSPSESGRRERNTKAAE